MNNLNLAKEVREQKLREGQEIGKLVLLAEARLGELFNRMPKATTNHKRQDLEIPSAGKFLNGESEEEESEEEEVNEEKPPQKPNPLQWHILKLCGICAKGTSALPLVAVGKDGGSLFSDKEV